MHVQYIQGFFYEEKRKNEMERTQYQNTQNAPCVDDQQNKTNALLPTTLVHKVGFHREMVERKETSYQQQQQQQRQQQ